MHSVPRSRPRGLRLPRRCRSSRAPRTGLTLLELTLALAMLTIGLAAMTSTTLATHKLKGSDTARQLAVAALEGLIQDIEVVADSTPKDAVNWAEQVVARFAAPNDVFPASGLTPWAGEAGVLDVQFVIDETTLDQDLDFDLGLPRDLDNDGLVDNPDVRTTARILPVVVRARWQGSTGARELVHGFYVLGF